MKTPFYYSLAAVLVLCTTVLAQDQQPPKGKISGIVFGDYFYNIRQRDTSKNDLNGFQLRRIYFTYDHAISSKFDARFRLDADQAALTSNGKIGVYVRDAYLKWKNVFEGSDLLFGISPTPAFDVSEEQWGYRSLEKTIMDLRGIVSSRDMGIDVKGKLTGDGLFNYWLKVGNNSGNSPEADKFKRFYGLLHMKASPEIQATVFADFDAEPKKLDPTNGQSKNNNRFAVAGFVSYKEENDYSLGIEGFYRTIQNNFQASPADPLTDEHSFGLTAFAWGSVADDLRLIGRFDLYDPNTSVDKDGVYLVIGAIDYMPDKDVHIMPNVEYQPYQADVASDVVARVTFYYIFK